MTLVAGLLALILIMPPGLPAADYSHARVVRLSLVQGEVKVSRTGGATDASAQNLAWEQAMINLPIREGFVVATGQGRTEVEFESGAAAYLAENSVLKFTELALSGGSRITRLTLTQGTATIFANPSHQDSFVVKTPALEVALTKKGQIRLDTYDDGTTVSALRGAADVLSTAGTTHITKGQSLSLRTANPNNVSIATIPKNDEWDRWVADREESVQSTYSYAQEHLYSPDYQPGIAELSVYGTWVSYGGYTNCWHPRGVGYGWRPFSSGRWSFYPGFGWTWISAEPWGWLPYHYGGWVYSPVYGWLWVPQQSQLWWADFRPSTAVFVEVNNHVGWLPMHPQDRRGDRPLNIEQGLNTENGPGSIGHVQLQPDEKLQVLGDAPRGLRDNGIHSAVPPEHVTRRIGEQQGQHDGEQRGSGIVYDGREGRYVNANPAPSVNSNNVNSNKNVDANEQGNRSASPSGAGDMHHISRDPDLTSRPSAPVTPNAPVISPVTHDGRNNEQNTNEHNGEQRFGFRDGDPRPTVPVAPDGEGVRPAPPENTAPPVQPMSPASMDRPRRMGGNDGNFGGHDDGDAPRSARPPRWSTVPSEANSPSHSTPAPSAAPRSEPPRAMPLPVPRSEPMGQPTYSPPSTPQAPRDHGNQGNHNEQGNRGEGDRPPHHQNDEP
jgi:hypothetical protein